jgi:uncharacterized protein YqhQ
MRCSTHGKAKDEFLMAFDKMRQVLSVIGCCAFSNIRGEFGAASLDNRVGRHSTREDSSYHGASPHRGSASDDQSVGGQAVIEGVMMRSSRRIVTAVRKPDREIITKNDPYIALSKRYKLLNIPILRGALSFFEMMFIGLKALNFSADIALEETEKAQKGTDWRRTRGARIRDGLTLAGIIVISFGMALGIFFALPLFLTEITGMSQNALAFNGVAGVIRGGFFLAYLWAISRWREIRRVLEYHGAEHKSIYAFESGEELTVENVRKHSTHHPRCGTSFLLIVVILAIVLFAVADTVVEMKIGHRPHLGQRFITHFSLLPILGGMAYELLKLSGKKRNNRYVQWLTIPGLWLQGITTQEPDDSQLEVAIVALKGSLEET